MRVTSLIFAAAVLASAPLAVAQTEAPEAPAGEATTPAPEAAPGEPTEPAADAVVEAAPAEPEPICRTISVRTESRLRSARQRVCRTQAQWDAIDEQAQRGRNDSASRNNN